MKQKGFTLIELVVVIVILGILAATALPKFVDLSSDAEIAAVKGVAGGISSASSINYAARALSKPGVTPPSLSGDGNTVCTTANLGAMLTSGWPGSQYSVAPVNGAATCVSGGTQECRILAVSNNAYSAVAGVTCY